MNIKVFRKIIFVCIFILFSLNVSCVANSLEGVLYTNLNGGLTVLAEHIANEAEAKIEKDSPVIGIIGIVQKKDKKELELSKKIYNVLTDKLSNKDCIIVERFNIDIAYAKGLAQKYFDSSFDENAAKKVGSVVGADAIVTGCFEFLDDILKIDLKIIKMTEGNEVITSEGLEIKDNIPKNFLNPVVYKTMSPDKTRLYVYTKPQNTKIKVFKFLEEGFLDITSKFTQGIKLDKGAYFVAVSASNYITKRKIVNIFPGEDAILYISLSKADFTISSRYIDNDNGTISDTKTGLMWLRRDDGVQRTFYKAESYAKNLTFAGYSDWRLPNIDEFKNILDGIADEAVFNWDRWWYWSSSTYEHNTAYAWYVNIDDDLAHPFFKSNKCYVRCVRGK